MVERPTPKLREAAHDGAFVQPIAARSVVERSTSSVDLVLKVDWYLQKS